MKVPSKYLLGLSKSQKEKKKRNIKKSRRLYYSGKKKEAYKLSKNRPVSKKKKSSGYTQRFRHKFGKQLKPLSNAFYKKTGIPLLAQKAIVNRGRAAFVTSGSRPSVSSGTAWGYARLYSFYFNKGKTFDTDIISKHNIKFK